MQWRGRVKCARRLLERSFCAKVHRPWLAPNTINVPVRVNGMRERKLHLTPGNPIYIVQKLVQSHFGSLYPEEFHFFSDMPEIVSTQANFDDLLIPLDHGSRSLSDTYYVDKDRVLRTHTTSHQTEYLRAGYGSFLAIGDCYRRDEIDRTHYPCFHQIDGVRVMEKTKWTIEEVEKDLKQCLESLMTALFPSSEIRWSPDTFPFTDPSFELEVKHDGDWLELLGSGVIKPQILENTGWSNYHGWAFGIGIERLAMRMFSITDIRQFWSEDPRFLQQYSDNEVRKFEPYSKFPPCYKDISFWIPDDFVENDFMEIVREGGGDLVEEVKLIDEFENKKTGRTSRCYRVNYRHGDRTLQNEEITAIQKKIRDELVNVYKYDVRG